ncbi:uncharacterized protein UBRO_20423 [Ustilago bromivora]|uniref:Uncharacterized protein n=1 Tax=Ustilago bromivora TaxID=307758 RepID=A0A1K0GWG7_9BASI|nr:uncharacterized protein UBRO_20423 [Ustilago bromivora]
MNLHIGKIKDQLSQLLRGVKQISATVQALAPAQPLPNSTPLSSGHPKHQGPDPGWIVYMSIQFNHTENPQLVAALLSHLESLIEFDATYHWKAIAKYHLAVWCQRFGKGLMEEWGCSDPNLHGCLLLPYLKPHLTTQSSSSSSSSLKAANRVPHSNPGNSTNMEICFRYNSPAGCNGCGRAHI